MGSGWLGLLPLASPCLLPAAVLLIRPAEDRHLLATGRPFCADSNQLVAELALKSTVLGEAGEAAVP